MFSHRWLLALKLFLPSWNFFNDFGAVTRVEVCLDPAATEPRWQPVFGDFTTSDWRRITFNPEGNLALQEQSLIERAAEELAGEQRDEAERFIARAVRPRLAALFQERAADRFCFRIVERTAGEAGEVRFVSAEFPLTEPAPCHS